MRTFVAVFLILACVGAYVSTNERAMYTYHLRHTEEADSLAYIVQKTPDGFESLIEEASPAVVRIEVYKEVPVRVMRFGFSNGRFRINEVDEQIDVAVGTGSGFFVSSDGYLVTNKHVVAYDNAAYVVDAGKEEYAAKVIYRDPVHDLAVMKVDGEDFKTLSLGTSTDLDIDDPVVAMGNALGKYVDSASYGKISAVKQSISVDDGIERNGDLLVLVTEKLTGLIQTTAKMYPGDSGGPLLNEEGEVVGVNVATTVGVALSYAVPAELAARTLRNAGVSGF